MVDEAICYHRTFAPCRAWRRLINPARAQGCPVAIRQSLLVWAEVLQAQQNRMFRPSFLVTFFWATRKK